MDPSTLLNAYVHKHFKTDPQFTSKRDGDEQPPSFIGSLTVPGQIGVNIYPGQGLPSKGALRKALSQKFIKANHILLLEDVDALEKQQSNSFAAVKEARLPTPPASVRPTDETVSTILRPYLLTSLVKSTTAAQLMTELAPLYNLTPDRLYYELYSMHADGLLKSQSVFSPRPAHSDHTVWVLKTAPMLISDQSQFSVLNFLQQVSEVPLPIQYQFRDKSAGLPESMFFTTTFIQLDWHEHPQTSIDKRGVSGKLWHATAPYNNKTIHRFAATADKDAFVPNALMFYLPVPAEITQYRCANSECCSLRYARFCSYNKLAT